MSDEGEKPPVEQVGYDLVPAPKKRKSGGAKTNPSHRRVVWLDSARVIDMEAFHRLKNEGLGAKRIARALGTVMATAQKLMAGVHWQQTAEKVRLFNQARGASIDPETGMPTAADLVKFGAKFEGITAHTTQGERDLHEMVKSAGVPAHAVEEAVRRLRVLAGAEEAGDLPQKVDTKWLQDTVDQRLGVVLTALDPVTIAGASVADLNRLLNTLIEKRALLRGEPTAIIRNEQRSGLDKVAAALLAEAARRGVVVDLPKGPGGYQEKEAT